MKTPEGYEKDEIKKYLDRIGAWFLLPYMAGFGKSGVPDIVACLRGVFWAIEVKREGKGPTKLQEDRRRAIVEAGGQWVAGTARVVIPYINRWLDARG